jgi:hypothetical protein
VAAHPLSSNALIPVASTLIFFRAVQDPVMETFFRANRVMSFLHSFVSYIADIALTINTTWLSMQTGNGNLRFVLEFVANFADF